MIPQQTKQLPKGWKGVKLSEVLDYEQPTEYIVNSKILEEETPIPVLTANKGFIKGYTKETKGICKDVPVIIFDDFTTDTKFVNFPFKVKSSAMKILKLKDKEALLKYIFYQMQTIDVRTTTHKRYYLSEYQNLNFLFPINFSQNISLEKQSLIVSAIETQFTRLDVAVKNLKAVKQKLGIYRKAVLKEAFENIDNKVPLAKLARVIDIDHKMPNKVERGVPFISPKDFFEPNGINFNNAKHISNEDFSRLSKKCNPQEGDIIYSRIGTIGKVRIVPDKIFQISYSLCLIKLNEKKDRDYLFWALQSPEIFEKAHKDKKSIGVPDLGLTEIRNFMIRYPLNEREKNKIVSSIESKFSVIDKVEETVNNALVKAERLRKSILKSAFEGKLVKEE